MTVGENYGLFNGKLNFRRLNRFPLSIVMMDCSGAYYKIYRIFRIISQKLQKLKTITPKTIKEIAYLKYSGFLIKIRFNFGGTYKKQRNFSANISCSAISIPYCRLTYIHIYPRILLFYIYLKI